MLFTVIGTLTHELGHITAAQLLGYETKLSYGYMDYFHKGYNEDEDALLLIEMSEKHKETPYYDLDDKTKEEYKIVFDRLEEKFPTNETHDYLVSLGGPAQTIITALIGFYILYRRESKYRYTYKLIDWLGVFLGLFILREVYNTLAAIVSVVFFNRSEFYADEFSLSRGFRVKPMGNTYNNSSYWFTNGIIYYFWSYTVTLPIFVYYFGVSRREFRLCNLV